MRAARHRVGSWLPSGASWLLPALLLWGQVGHAARHGDTPEAWLRAMEQALIEQDYVGEFSYLTSDDLYSLKVVHAVVEGERRERIVHLDGAPREIVRIGDTVICVVEAGDEMMELAGSVPAGPFARSFSPATGILPDVYDARFAGQGRVAQRAARIIEVMPRDENRYGFRLWLDEETAMLLRSELLDDAGARLEIFQFVRVEIGGPIAVSLLEPSDGARIMHNELSFAESEPVPPEASRWMPRWLPDGFRMAAADVRRVSGQNRAVESQRYSDGVASFSVFVEAGHMGVPDGHARRRGATAAVVREHAPVDGQRYVVTVVGEIPVDTARQIAEAVHPLR